MRVPAHYHPYTFAYTFAPTVTFAFTYICARARDRTLGWAADKRRKIRP